MSDLPQPHSRCLLHQLPTPRKQILGASVKRRPDFFCYHGSVQLTNNRVAPSLTHLSRLFWSIHYPPHQRRSHFNVWIAPNRATLKRTIRTLNKCLIAWHQKAILRIHILKILSSIIPLPYQV